MDRKFSYELVATALDFVRRAEIEMGPLGETKVHAMLDAFDPGLKRQMLIDMISGDTANIGRQMTVTIVAQPTTGDRKVIHAIKSLRQATDFGLKDTKELIDKARDQGTVTFSATLSKNEIDELAESLLSTGFRVKGY